MAKQGGDFVVNSILANRMMWSDPIAIHQMNQLVENSTLMSRAALINRGGGEDPRRNINDECGYPDVIAAEDYKQLYDREPIASRVVQVLPLECWQVTPSVYEDEDVDTITPFEQAFHDIPKSLRGESWFQDEEGSPFWETLMRADILSGIGSYGVILLGIDDGKKLDEPIEGFDDGSPTGPIISESGMQAEDGAISLLPGNKEKQKKLPFTTNAFPVKDDEEDDSEQPQYDPEYDTEEDVPEEDMPEEGASFDEDTEPEIDPETGEPIDGGMDTPDEFSDQPIQTKRKLLFMRCFDESLAQITRYEADPTNIRYGQPKEYNITLTDPKYMKGGTGLSNNVVKVHWSRVIHIADNLGSSEVMGTPRMEPVYNRLLDIRKLHSGSAEMYWKGAFPGFNLATHPQLGGDVAFDSDDIKNQMEQYMNGLQRYTAFIGMSMNSLAPQVVDPASQIQVQLEAICVRLAVPMRVFMGSERGELASSQDTGTWNDRLKQRHNGYITPKIIVQTIDRFIKIGILPEPGGYSVSWPDMSAASDLEKAQKANMITTALSAYVQSGIESIMTLTDFFVKILGWDEEEARQVEENVRTQSENDMLTQDPAMEEEMMQAQMEQMTNPELVPDNIQTGDQHHYEAGSQDKAAELEHERIISGQENGPPQGPPGAGGPPMAGGPPIGKPGAKGKPPVMPPKGKKGRK